MKNPFWASIFVEDISNVVYKILPCNVLVNAISSNFVYFQSKQKSRSCSFETMNREKRMFVHEYCSHFGCESAAYDAEPKRNVVATAQRDKVLLTTNNSALIYFLS